MSYTLYRAYGRHGELLYIGCTSNLEQRMAAHRATSKWWHLHIAIMTFDIGDDKATAFAAEAAAIVMEQPSHNRQGKELPLPKYKNSELQAMGMVCGRTAANLAGLEQVPHPQWKKYIKPSARSSSDGMEYYDAEYCRRMAVVDRKLTFVTHLNYAAARCNQLVQRQLKQVAA